MKEILLIDREFGAGCSAVGEKVAAHLNWKLFDHALSEEVARLAKIPVEECKRLEERTDPWLQRLVNLIWRGSFDRNLPSPDLAILDTDRLVSLTREAVEHAADQKPCVIIGRGAPYFLRRRTDIYCIFLYGSRDRKYQRILKRVDNQKQALELLNTMDRDRRRFVRHYFGHRWPDRRLFHALLNTDMGDDCATDAIIQLLNSANRNEQPVEA